MQLLDATQVRTLCDPAALVAALREGFAHADRVHVPDRVNLGLDEELGSRLLLKPAWELDGWLGVKVATHHPRNGRRGLPAIHASYVLIETVTGRPSALLDGTELTRLRTAAVSALAADHLAPAEVGEHLLVGAGNVCAALPAHYAAVRDVRLTRVWARRPEQAHRLVEQLRADGYAADVAEDLRAAVRTADVVSAATPSTDPLILGEDVRPGTHVDLVGAFTPTMVEADEALVRAASVFVDVPAAIQESGDLAGPIERGSLTPADVRGDLSDLAAGRHTGRQEEGEITVFKSVGTALADLVAAVLVVERAGRR